MSREELEKAFVNIEIPVQWGNMDAAQHVNNTVYLRWIESARIEMFRKLNGGTFKFEKVVPILAWQDCKYIFPLTFPDTARIMFNVSLIKSDRIECEGKIFSKERDRLAAISKNVLMAYDMQDLKKLPLPQKWIDKIVAFYGKGILER
ncbi:MAG: acyl-CoA thioesterase [Aurantibacter sp.]